MKKSEIEKIIKLALVCGSEAGAWLGQVEFEEYLDRRMLDVVMEKSYAKKVALPLHQRFTMDTESGKKIVRYPLRGKDWRAGVRKEYEIKMQEMENLLCSLAKKATNHEGKKLKQLSLFGETT